MKTQHDLEIEVQVWKDRFNKTLDEIVDRDERIDYLEKQVAELEEIINS